MAKRGAGLHRNAAAALIEEPRGSSAEIAASSSGDAQFVIFKIASGSYGLPLVTVAEILRVPPLARMPLAPPSLLGLANLRGIVLPIVSLRQLLRLPDVPVGDTTRVIVIDGDAPVGFVVDGVTHLLSLPASQVEKDDAGAGIDDPGLLDGVIKGSEGETTIKILNAQRLLRGQFAELGASPARVAARTSIAEAKTNLPAMELQQLVAMVSFDIGAQEYALPLERVREIIPLPDHISEVPRSQEAVLGVVTLRERLLPLVSLRALLGLPSDAQREQRGKVVVLSMGRSAVGVVADRTRDILRVDPKAIDPAPALLTRGAGEAEITSICRLDHGRRLVALLSPDRLFRSDLVRRVLAERDEAAFDDVQTDADAMADEQFIIFQLGDQQFGMPIGAVEEIARSPEHITRLPKAPAFIDGVINLRGSVVPVVDLRRRFELKRMEQGGSQRILVLATGGGKTGFMVDSVSEVMSVPAGSISPAPALSSEQMRLISRVANFDSERRMILLVDPAHLLDRVEAEVLEKFSRSAAEPKSETGPTSS